MISESEAEKTILRALVTLNAERGPDEQIEISASTPLLRDDTQIDSLELVSLIADVETTLNTKYGLDVSLADDRAFTRPVSPFATVKSLRDYIFELSQGG
jgi:acyl carrier protein